jgi:hypothetical protein
MLVMRTSESGTDALGQLVAPQQTVRLYNLAFAVNPLRFDRVEPRALLGQQRQVTIRTPASLRPFLTSRL